MDQRRWLLPYIHGIDMQAITAVISQADAAGATLVTVALICMPTKSQKRGAHLRLIQQMKAFLEAVNNKALRLGLPLERHVVVTHNAVRSLKPLITELHCDAIVLVSRREQEIFLRPRQYKQVLVDPPAPLVLIRLPEWARQQGLWKRLLSRLWQSEGDQNGIGQPIEEQEEPLWIRMEEHLRR